MIGAKEYQAYLVMLAREAARRAGWSGGEEKLEAELRERMAQAATVYDLAIDEARAEGHIAAADLDAVNVALDVPPIERRTATCSECRYFPEHLDSDESGRCGRGVLVAGDREPPPECPLPPRFHPHGADGCLGRPDARDAVDDAEGAW